ncbi:tRNA adenosine(34) deaminase TadA [Tessaracoccus sp. Y1736]
MRLALEEAEAARRHGDVPIGAVILDSAGAPIASAGNERELTGDPTAHAEVVAIRRAAEELGQWRLTDCTLVVTLEPCTMCAGAIVASRIGHLVFGAFDEKAGAVSSLWDVVRDPRLNHRPTVTSGVLADECGAALESFFGERR